MFAVTSFFFHHPPFLLPEFLSAQAASVTTEGKLLNFTFVSSIRRCPFYIFNSLLTKLPFLVCGSQKIVLQSLMSEKDVTSLKKRP